VRSKALVCVGQRAAIFGSKPAQCIDVGFFFFFFLRRTRPAHHEFRGALPADCDLETSALWRVAAWAQQQNVEERKRRGKTLKTLTVTLDFKLSPCPVCNMFSFG